MAVLLRQPATPTLALTPSHTLTIQHRRLKTHAQPSSVAFLRRSPSSLSSSAPSSSSSGSYSIPSSPISLYNPYPFSNFNAANQRVNATWNAQIQVSNPNKKLSISYGEVVSSVFRKDYFLSETRIGSFVQDTRSSGAVVASYSMVDSFVDGEVVDEMNEERRGGEIKFNLKALADLAFRYGGWRGRRRFLTVWCDDVVVTASSGKMTGGPKNCSVY